MSWTKSTFLGDLPMAWLCRSRSLARLSRNSVALCLRRLPPGRVCRPPGNFPFQRNLLLLPGVTVQGPFSAALEALGQRGVVWRLQRET